VSFRNRVVNTWTWLALAGVILTSLRATAAEDSEKSPPTTLTVAAAADLKFALDDLVKEFEEKNPETKVNVTYGSSGNFFAQIQNGAPFELLFSADIGYPQKLAEKGLGADDVFLYAIGRIVVWVSKDSPVDVDKLGIKALLEPSIRKIAVANPEHAPYGRAAVAAMKALHIYDQVASRLVYGENIAQTAQFVQSGVRCPVPAEGFLAAGRTIAASNKNRLASRIEADRCNQRTFKREISSGDMSVDGDGAPNDLVFARL
jgi:molybdate transport system substrate-binding protein